MRPGAVQFETLLKVYSLGGPAGDCGIHVAHTFFRLFRSLPNFRCSRTIFGTIPMFRCFLRMGIEQHSNGRLPQHDYGRCKPGHTGWCRSERHPELRVQQTVRADSGEECVCVFINRICENRNLLITCDLLIAFKERVRLFEFHNFAGCILGLITCCGYCAGKRQARLSNHLAKRPKLITRASSLTARCVLMARPKTRTHIMIFRNISLLAANQPIRGGDFAAWCL